MGFGPTGIENQAGLGCRERGMGSRKLSPFSSSFKQFLKSKPAGAPVHGARAVPGQSVEQGVLDLPSCGLPAAAQPGQKIRRQRSQQTLEVLGGC